MEVIIRPEKQSEESVTRRIVREAFGDDVTPALVDALRVSSAWRGLSYIACADGEPVAHVSFTRGWLDAPSRLVEVLILSPMSVVPSHQRQGIGSRLITEALAALESRPEPLVFLEGSPAYYSRLGFLPAYEAGFTAATVRTPQRAFQFVALPKYESWMTGALVYPDAFWEFDAAGLR